MFLQKNAQKDCIFLQKNAVFLWAHRRKPQEIAGGFQGSRIKNASQLSQEIKHRRLEMTMILVTCHARGEGEAKTYSNR